MRPLPFLCSALLLLPPLRAQEPTRFHQYVAGQKLGGSEIRNSKGPAGDLMESREWLKLSRLGIEISQEIRQTATRGPDGRLHFTWRVLLSQEPFEGEADWSPEAPRLLKLRSKGSPPRDIEVPEGALLWPGDSERRLQEAARSSQPVRLKRFTFPTQQWSDLELGPPRPAPLRGYADAVRFEGSDTQGPARMEVKLWVSPDQGEIKSSTTFSGLEMVSQRENLPPPGAAAPGNFFDASLKAIPYHPFLAWLPEVIVRWSGKGVPSLPEDPQQSQLEPGRIRLRRASAPSKEEAAELPVTGQPTPEDAPFLAATPLLQFQDPVFEGLLRRLRPPAGATRWLLAQKVTAFVYDWIDRKDFSVGFASALEVGRSPQGDCTEHGVLAAALLRKLGVPARGVVGWIALDQTLGLHFWVEVKLNNRWVPVDPTFDQAPASAFRLKLGTTDLGDLGTLGWESAAQTFSDGQWNPEGPWAKGLRLTGDTLAGPGGLRLRIPGGTWTLAAGRVLLNGRYPVKANGRPYGETRQDAKPLAGGGRTGWWHSGSRDGFHPQAPRLWLPVAGNQWLEIGSVPEAEAYRLLEALEIRAPE